MEPASRCSAPMPFASRGFPISAAWSRCWCWPCGNRSAAGGWWSWGCSSCCRAHWRRSSTKRRPRRAGVRRPAEVSDFTFLFILIPHALAPLAALLCAGGIIRDEVEEQTLTYLLLRPLPRTAIYAIKLLAALVTAALLTSFFTVATLVFIAWLTGEPPTAGYFAQGVKIAAIFSLAQVAYCGLFALLALLMRRALLVGVVYIIFFEGLLATFDTIARRMTVMYYFRVLVLRWLNPASGATWEFNLKTAPTAANCVLTLLVAGLVLTIVGSLIFASGEFRMKTPEGE